MPLCDSGDTLSKIMISRIRVLFAVCACFPLVYAQQGHGATPTPEKPVALLSGLGVWSHPIATSSPEAQKFFNQGLILNYSFNRYEALRSFRKAAELDPKAAMAYFGMAIAQGPYVNMDMDPDIHLK